MRLSEAGLLVCSNGRDTHIRWTGSRARRREWRPGTTLDCGHCFLFVLFSIVVERRGGCDVHLVEEIKVREGDRWLCADVDVGVVLDEGPEEAWGVWDFLRRFIVRNVDFSRSRFGLLGACWSFLAVVGWLSCPLQETFLFFFSQPPPYWGLRHAFSPASQRMNLENRDRVRKRGIWQCHHVCLVPADELKGDKQAVVSKRPAVPASACWELEKL